MPAPTRHRGPAPGDDHLFAPAALPSLRQATADLGWLLGRGYPADSSLKLVGDRFQLTARQRLAVGRCAAAPATAAARRARELPAAGLAGQRLLIDGFNLLVTLETALAGGLVFRGRDGCLRDLAGVHGTWRRLAETIPALELAGTVLAELRPAAGLWLLDRPVSNSGRLRGMLLELAAAHGWPWEAELLFNPDRRLATATDPVATSDHAILDQCGSWFNLAAAILPRLPHPPRLLDLA
ncbi:MAG: DUF434 domain-containing protein [Lentisphaeria bacterium]|jgi:hypothetical protein